MCDQSGCLERAAWQAQFTYQSRGANGLATVVIPNVLVCWHHRGQLIRFYKTYQGRAKLMSMLEIRGVVPSGIESPKMLFVPLI